MGEERRSGADGDDVEGGVEDEDAVGSGGGGEPWWEGIGGFDKEEFTVGVLDLEVDETGIRRNEK